MAVRAASKRFRRKNQGVLGIGMLSLAVVLAAVILSRGKTTVEAKDTQAPTVVAEFDTVLIPVPSESVPAGTRVRNIKFNYVKFPKHQVPATAIIDVSSYLEGTTIAALPAKLPLFPDNITLNSSLVNPVVDQIPPGMRAMTLRVDATSAVEGWAGSGAVVDLLLVQNNVTTVVAEGVRILSAERKVAPVDTQASPSIPTTVTLLVTQEQCLAINTAMPLGKIAFALRGIKDTEGWRDTTFTSDRLKKGGVVKDSKGIITGYVSVTEDENKRSFALTNGKWVKTEVVPEGFLVGGNQ